MSKYKITKQKSLMPDIVPNKHFGDVRDKLLELKNKNGDKVFAEDKKLAIAFWLEFEGLREVLESGNPKNFITWFLTRSTEYESISRSSRKLKEEGIVARSRFADERATEHAEYWKNH